MRKYLLLLSVGGTLILSCDNPRKNEQVGTTAKDAVSQTSPTSPGKDTTTPTQATESVVDTLTTASPEPEPAFDESDPLSYLNLDNYIQPVSVPLESDVIQEVDSTCALLVYPTDAQLEELKNKNGENFQSIAMDNTYYHGLAIEMLDSINVETITAETRLIRFLDKKGQRTWTIDIRKKGAPAWNLIFFREGKAPEIVPYADLSHDKIYEYFEIKRK